MLVPHFSANYNTFAILTKESWQEIFSSVQPEKNKTLWWWRKMAKVRIATRDAIFISQSKLYGTYESTDQWWRKIYGEVWFHTRHQYNKEIPYEDEIQLMTTAAMGVTYQKDLCSTSVYMTPKTLLSKEVYRKDQSSGKTLLLPMNRIIPITNEDYNTGLLIAEKVIKEFNYAPPPRKEDRYF